MAIRADNPWRRLPPNAPFLLPEDKDIVAEFNHSLLECCASAKEHSKFWIHDELLPEPFLGDPEAPVVLLNKNPGYSSPNDLTGHTPPASATGAWNNLLHKRTSFPFYLLDPDEHRALGYKWWNNKLKSLIESLGDDRRLVAQSILCVEYFPYHSRRFGHAGLALPSQKYSFDLVRSAIRRHAVIVIMRGEQLWRNEIRELQSYSLLYPLVNPQNPAISRDNFTCLEGYESVDREIRARKGCRRGIGAS